jgi:hypothetical protein
VDGSTARRRRHASSANSVTVAQLKAKSLQAEQAGGSAINARTGAGAPPRGRMPETGSAWEPDVAPAQPPRPPSTELVKYDDSTDDRGTSNRLARAIITTLVTMGVCGAVTALAVLSGGPPHRLSPSVPIVQPAVVSGPAVVRPKAIIEQLASGALGQIPAEPAGGGAGAQAAEHRGALADRITAQATVSEFYGALPPHKPEAFHLLGPAMQAGGLEPFEDGWLSTRSVEARPLRPKPEDGGLLRVAVSVEQFDGSVLQLVQLVEVRPIQDGNAPPEMRIVGVQLLAAHQG